MKLPTVLPLLALLVAAACSSSTNGGAPAAHDAGDEGTAGDDAGAAGIGIGFITEDIGWVSADDVTAPTLRTTDGGQTWTKDSALLSPVNRFRFLSSTTAFAIGATVWRLDVPWTGGDP